MISPMQYNGPVSTVALAFDNLLEELKQLPGYIDQIVHVEDTEARPPRYGTLLLHGREIKEDDVDGERESDHIWREARDKIPRVIREALAAR